VIRTSLFRGDVTFEYYLDENKKIKMNHTELFAYMGDAQYVLNKNIYATFTHGLYIYAKSNNRKSSFMIDFYGRSKSTSIQLH
jgi:hypothetical protein